MNTFPACKELHCKAENGCEGRCTFHQFYRLNYFSELFGFVEQVTSAKWATSTHPLDEHNKV